MSDQYDQSWAELKEIHAEYLDKYGVKLPKDGSARQLQLSVLYEAYKADPQQYVDKNEISRIVSQLMPHLGTDQQVRHLKRDGWDLQTGKRGWHRLNPYNPSPVFVNEAVKRANLLSATSFEGIKAAYHHTCVTCGAKEGALHRQYQEIVKLQQAHKDPAKPQALENIIPQCQFCNQSYKSDFTFDDKGRVRAIASVEPVRRASKAVKKAVREFLKKSLGD